MLLPEVASATDLDDALDELSLYELRNLEITVATKTKTTMQEAPSIVSVITGDEIKNMGARNIIDVLRTVPGFDLSIETASAIHRTYVRGMTSSTFNEKTKFMLDGHSLSVNFGEIHGFFDRLPVDNIKQLEIIRGPGSALYGTGAFIGVVNIVTKKGGDDPSKISVSGGSYGTFKPTGELSYKKGDLSVYAYAEYYKTDGYHGQIDSDLFGTYPASAAPGNVTTNDNSQTFQTTIGYKDFYFSGFFGKVEEIELPVGVARALTDEDDVGYTMAFAEAGYEFHLQDKGSIQLKAYYDYGEQDVVTELFSEETTSTVFKWKEDEGMLGSPNAKNSIIGGEITADYNVYDGIRLVAGTSLEKSELYDVKSYANGNITGASLIVDGETYAPYQYLGGYVDISENGNWLREADRTVFAVYGQGMFDIRKLFSLERGVSALSLTAGLRYDDYDDTGSTINPRAGLVYAPVKDLYFKLLYGTAFRAPSFREMYVTNNPGAEGNPNLEPETISTAEFLVGYDFTERIRSTLTLFNVEAEDLIQRITIPGEKAYFDNVGSMESRGIEAELKVSFDKRKYAYLNLTYQDVRNTTGETITSEGGQTYTQEDFNPGSIPYFIANLGLNYDISRYVNGNISVNYVGKKTRSGEKKWDGEKRVYVDDREPLKERTLVNAALTFGNFYKGLEIRLSGYNLFDADHRDPDPAGSIANDVPKAGRTFMGTVSYSF